MITPIEAYSEAGKAAAIARNQHDEARSLHYQWYVRAVGLEAEQDRQHAANAWNDAYKAHRAIPPVD